MSGTISPPEILSPLVCLGLSPPQERMKIAFQTVNLRCRHVIFSAALIITAAVTFVRKAWEHLCVVTP